MMSKKQIVISAGIILMALLGVWGSKLRRGGGESWEGASHKVAIVAITTEPENLWDEEKGIYVKGNHDNYLQEGKEWERLGEVRFYEPDGRLGFKEQIGLRIHGKNRGMAQKQFRLYFKDGKGEEGLVEYPVFGKTGTRRLASLILRVGDYQSTMLRDRLAGELVRQNSRLDVQRTRPVVVYLNGEYWGIYELAERFDETYFREKYQIMPSFLGIIEVPLNSGDNKGLAVADKPADEEEVERYNKLLAEVRNCQACWGYRSINKYVEADSLVDYLLFELYFANVDWPYNNTRVWRYKVEPLRAKPSKQREMWDGRFRWLLFDMDAGFGGNSGNRQDVEAVVKTDSYEQLADEAWPFRNLFYDGFFQEKYLQRLESLLGKGLKAEEAEAVVERLADEVRAEMPRQIERWGGVKGDDDSEGIKTMEEWEENLELLKEFLRQRPESFLEQTKRFFERVRLIS